LYSFAFYIGVLQWQATTLDLGQPILFLSFYIHELPDLVVYNPNHVH
jgi:hypothetical protein